jgi:hypothetical protein
LINIHTINRTTAISSRWGEGDDRIQPVEYFLDNPAVFLDNVPSGAVYAAEQGIP